MVTPPSYTASPLFLRDDEIRRGIELLYFGYGHLTRSIDHELGYLGLGRAHHRALYFISRQPDITVGDLLSILAVTKQALGRVLNDLMERSLVESRPGERDRRHRLLRVTPDGAELENRLFEALRAKMAEAYVQAGQRAVSGFSQVLEGLISDETHAVIAALDRKG